MTEISLSFYLLPKLEPVARAFGSGDAGLVQRVLSATGSLIDERWGARLRPTVEEGLAQIVRASRIEAYSWPTALAVEMLFAAFGSTPSAFGRIELPGYTEEYVEPLRTLNQPIAATAMNVLAYGQEVQLPLPCRDWDDVSGQAYFDAAKRDATLRQLDAIGPAEAAAAALDADLLGAIDPPDLAHLLAALQSVLAEAAAKAADVAVFRHGGV